MGFGGSPTDNHEKKETLRTEKQGCDDFSQQDCHTITRKRKTLRVPKKDGLP